MSLLRSALVIARRDFVATVMSRTFIMFLLGPLIAFGFAQLIGNVAGNDDAAAARPKLAVVALPADQPTIRAAVDRLDGRIHDVLPAITLVPPTGDAAAQARALIGQGSSAVLTGLPDAPRLIGAPAEIDRVGNAAEVLIDAIANDHALNRAGIARPSPKLVRQALALPSSSPSLARHVLARAAQLLVFVLTVLLSGMLLSNLVEEKSNKVIEVLAAAVPIDRIFAGKMIAMLGVSLCAIALWGSLLAGVAAVKLTGGGPLPAPAVGWPAFVALLFLYFVTNYLIIGGIFLGVGAQAASVREVQTISMPLTMAQLANFALASATLAEPLGPLATFAVILPVSSPLTMIARAAQDGALWPHLFALAWQALWIAIIIRFAARRFRIGVLKSGVPKSRWKSPPKSPTRR